MTGLRRALLLVTAMLAVTFGFPGGAQAAYTAQAVMPTVRVSTATVLPPTALSTVGSVCSNGTLRLHLTWTASTTSRVTGYAVRMYTTAGINWALGSTSAGTTSYDASVSVRVNGRPTACQFTLTTTTDYGWATESARTGAITC
jgi:hypothetical protein